jgi:hypothetical protein
MVRNELISRSPLRILEQSTHGGVGKGNIGVVAARKGVGKTACLVHIATDQLFQGKHVIHVSFAADTKHIVAWYEDIFEEIARRYKLDCAMDVHDDIIKHRVIMNFRQDTASVSKIHKSIRSMIQDGGFSADVLIIDGFDFEKTTPEEFAVYRDLAKEMAIEIWFSATIPGEVNGTEENGIPRILGNMIDEVAILIVLEPRENLVRLHLIKDHDLMMIPDSLHLKLDPQILLIAEES